MKTRLLLGSAAALIGVSQAHAADAIVAIEPEPVEYVRVCDVYGAGFFYIPGTETCLSIGGYIYFQVGAESRDAGDTPALLFHPGSANVEGWYTGIRTRVNFDARSETELGTLRSYIRVEASWNGTNGLDGGSDGPAYFDQAYLELGGLRAGYSESAWTATQGGGVSNFPGAHAWGGLGYRYMQRALVAYTHQFGAGYYATVSLEDDNFAGGGYVPDVVAKVGVNQGWGGAWGQFGYDEAFLGSDGYAAKVGMQINVPNSPGSSLRLVGSHSNNANDYAKGQFDGVSSEWSVLASYNHQFTSSFGMSLAGHYYFNVHNGLLTTNDDAFAALVSAVWTPVENFEVRNEVAYSKQDGMGGTTSGFLRFTRYF